MGFTGFFSWFHLLRFEWNPYSSRHIDMHMFRDNEIKWKCGDEGERHHFSNSAKQGISSPLLVSWTIIITNNKDCCVIYPSIMIMKHQAWLYTVLMAKSITLCRHVENYNCTFLESKKISHSTIGRQVLIVISKSVWKYRKSARLQYTNYTKGRAPSLFNGGLFISFIFFYVVPFAFVLS